MKFQFHKQLSTLLIIAFIFSCQETQESKQLTQEDYIKATTFLKRDLNDLVLNKVLTQEWSGEDYVIYSRNTEAGKEFISVNLIDNSKEVAFDHEKLANSLSGLTENEVDKDDLPISKPTFSQDGSTLSFTYSRKTYNCNLNDYSISEKKSELLTPKRNEHVSPNGKLAAYIDNYNLWVKNLETGNTQQLTFNGVKDYGYATDNAGWTKSDRAVLKWSPNSDKIATFRQDARGLGEMYLISTNVGHPKLEAWKHPLPGDLYVFKLERLIIDLSNSNKIIKLDMEPDFQRSTTTDHIAGRGGEFLDVEWYEDGSKLAFVSSSRDHKIAELKVADAKTGSVESILKEEVATYFESGVRMRNWHVLEKTNEVVWYSERDNWGHLYLYDLESKNLKHQITKGDWAVQQLLHIDEDSRELFFTAGGKEEGNPYHRYLYKIGFDGNNVTNISSEFGTHSISFSPNHRFFIDTYSTTENPPISVLRNRNGEKVLDLEVADITSLKAQNWQQPVEFSVKARDSVTDLYGLMYLPSHYNENSSYPVLNYIYPGPQSGSIRDFSFRAVSRDYQAVAELGFVVVAVNAMGTPGRSKSFHDAYYGNMGDNGLPDNILTIKQLAQTYKGMDIERVGIWGHSGGGFASTRAVFAYPDFYDVAVSGAGNHDNRNYEADWGEKWQGLLEYGTIEGKNDKTTNYDNQANQLIAENLKGKLLISHGSMDNNVHPSSTMLVVEALIKANKDFDMILFPNKRHGYGDMTNYMTRKRWDYWVKHLLNMEPPKEFSLEHFD